MTLFRRAFPGSSSGLVLALPLLLACSGQTTDAGVEATGGNAQAGENSGGATAGGSQGSGGQVGSGGGRATGGSAAGGASGGQPSGSGGNTGCENFVPDDCGACFCAGGQIACTDVYCPPPECQAGETKDDGCNTCSCSEGSWVCTERDCVTPACQEGATMDVDCNSCICEDGAWSCTEKVCSEVACGARAGDTCTADEYCAYQEGDWCGAADAEAICRPRPEACDLSYSPVCGCDGQTHSNACVAASAGSGVYKNEPCP